MRNRKHRKMKNEFINRQMESSNMKVSQKSHTLKCKEIKRKLKRASKRDNIR